MSAFDHEKFNGFARNSLDDLLFRDLQSLYVFNERDMHAAAYMYIREYFSKNKRDNVYVRCEPRIGGTKPDIVVYDRGDPTYLLEFKMLMDPDRLNVELVYQDLDKMADLIDDFPSIKWGFFHLIYDNDEIFKPVDATLRRNGYKKLSITSINARRQEDNARRRVGYDNWRKEYDKLISAHKQFS